MRYTKKISVWPVGFTGGLLYESPILENNKVVGWRAAWKPDRPFATDMAGFAINTQMLFDNPEHRFRTSARRGHLETDFLERLNLTKEDLEPKANGCTQVGSDICKAGAAA